jgi:hypothetical protein
MARECLAQVHEEYVARLADIPMLAWRNPLVIRPVVPNAVAPHALVTRTAGTPEGPWKAKCPRALEPRLCLTSRPSYLGAVGRRFGTPRLSAQGQRADQSGGEQRRGGAMSPERWHDAIRAPRGSSSMQL